MNRISKALAFGVSHFARTTLLPCPRTFFLSPWTEHARHPTQILAVAEACRGCRCRQHNGRKRLHIWTRCEGGHSRTLWEMGARMGRGQLTCLPQLFTMHDFLSNSAT